MSLTTSLRLAITAINSSATTIFQAIRNLITQGSVSIITISGLQITPRIRINKVDGLITQDSSRITTQDGTELLAQK